MVRVARGVPRRLSSDAIISRGRPPPGHLSRKSAITRGDERSGLILATQLHPRLKTCRIPRQMTNKRLGRVVKLGRSMAVVLPNDRTRGNEIEPGDELEIEYDGRVSVNAPVKRRREDEPRE